MFGPDGVRRSRGADAACSSLNETDFITSSTLGRMFHHKSNDCGAFETAYQSTLHGFLQTLNRFSYHDHLLHQMALGTTVKRIRQHSGCLTKSVAKIDM